MRGRRGEKLGRISHSACRYRASIVRVNGIYNVAGKLSEFFFLSKLSELCIPFVLAQHVHQTGFAKNHTAQAT